MAGHEDDEREVESNFSDEGGEGGQTGSEGKIADMLARQDGDEGAEDHEGEDGEGKKKQDRGDHFEGDEGADHAPEEAEEAKEGEEEGGDEAAKAQAARVMIPKSRFDEVNTKMKTAVARAEQAEAKLKQIEASQQQAADAEAFDFDDAERRYMAALTEEGDQETALAIRQEIRAAEKAMFKAQMSGTTNAAAAQIEAENSTQEVIATAIELYPFLDSTKEKTMNADAIEMVIALRDSELSKGKSMAQALSIAVSKVGPLYSKTVEDDGKTQVQQRQEDGLRKAAAAQRQQPGQIGRFGEQSGKRTANVAAMSEKEFDSLPEDVKREMRGDKV